MSEGILSIGTVHSRIVKQMCLCCTIRAIDRQTELKWTQLGADVLQQPSSSYSMVTNLQLFASTLVQHQGALFSWQVDSSRGNVGGLSWSKIIGGWSVVLATLTSLHTV